MLPRKAPRGVRPMEATASSRDLRCTGSLHIFEMWPVDWPGAQTPCCCGKTLATYEGRGEGSIQLDWGGDAGA
jgi:hypothetical protein